VIRWPWFQNLFTTLPATSPEIVADMNAVALDRGFGIRKRKSPQVLRGRKQRLEYEFGRRRSAVDERDVRRNRETGKRLDEISREGYRAAVDQAFEAQKTGMRLSRRFFENWVETLDDHAELQRRTFSSLQELVKEQREVFQVLSRESGDAYDGFLDSLDGYQEEISKLDKRAD
jgi:hypothetical protein